MLVRTPACCTRSHTSTSFDEARFLTAPAACSRTVSLASMSRTLSALSSAGVASASSVSLRSLLLSKTLHSATHAAARFAGAIADSCFPMHREHFAIRNNATRRSTFAPSLARTSSMKLWTFACVCVCLTTYGCAACCLRSLPVCRLDFPIFPLSAKGNGQSPKLRCADVIVSLAISGHNRLAPRKHGEIVGVAQQETHRVSADALTSMCDLPAERFARCDREEEEAPLEEVAPKSSKEKKKRSRSDDSEAPAEKTSKKSKKSKRSRDSDEEGAPGSRVSLFCGQRFPHH